MLVMLALLSVVSAVKGHGASCTSSDFRSTFSDSLTSFMMRATKSVTTVTALMRLRFLAINQKAFFEDRQKDVLKMAT